MKASVFPAYAGMIPPERAAGANSRRVPRIRGDDPQASPTSDVDPVCSPHTRG